MIDQAYALRTLVRDRATCAEAEERRAQVYTVAVTSGKGGVGKTSLAVNLSLLLARFGRRVRLVDADFGLSNAEVLLGVAPVHTLSDVLRGEVDIRSAWIDVPGGIKLLSSGSGLEEMANLDGPEGVRLMNQALSCALDGDVVVIDTAPGIDEPVVSLLALADEVMVVTTPEPTSITDAYAALKVLISRSPYADVTLVANCCTSPAQASSLAEALNSVCRRFLGRGFQRYEYLPSDAAVGRAVRSQKPVVTVPGKSAVEPWLRRIAIRLEERVRDWSSRSGR
ncbi:MAG: MinD/ParA family protein [Armatimonadetes bacterium]|nr:MinD/ParA family protein [Armatimonadota bacterium]